ncbi:MAG: UDP-glucose 4-epimerase GalE [Gemmatales bacterium]|nr:MAG: UDP-glucose 4-epimerase GalE [Gemmatales bacterium]
MRILVTGGAGYIGSHAVRFFLERGHQVWVYDNLCRGHHQAVPAECLIVGDLEEMARLDQAIIANRIEACVHFAGFAAVAESVREPAKYYRNNVVNTLHLLECLRHNGVKRFVFSSTAAVYGVPDRSPITEDAPLAPINPYGRSKLAVERILEDYTSAYQWGCAALRYFNAAGAHPDGTIGEDHNPETHLIPLVLQVALGLRREVEIFGTDYPTPDGTCIRDYVHVNDLAEAHLLVLEHLQPGQMLRYNLGIGRGYSVREVIETAKEVTGRTIAVKEAPRRPGDPPILVASADKIQKELGWRPRFDDLKKIIETAWNWQHARPRGFRS